MASEKAVSASTTISTTTSSTSALRGRLRSGRRTRAGSGARGGWPGTTLRVGLDGEFPVGGRVYHQLIEGVVWQLKDVCRLESPRAKTLGGLFARLAAKVAAYTCGQVLNTSLGRPLRHLASLLT